MKNRLLLGWITAAVVVAGLTVLASIPQSQALSLALARLLDLNVIAGIILGSAIGIVVGAIPGISALTAIAVMMPLTFGWDSGMALYFLVSISGAAMFAGAAPSILLNVPGDPHTAALCFDGYPMTRKGQGGRALGAMGMATITGAIVGIVSIILLLPFVRAIVLSFSQPEFFWIMIMAIVAVSFAIRTNMLKGLFAGGVGMLVSLLGYSPVLAVNRFTGDSYYLYDGLALAATVTGIFALSEMYELQIEGEGKIIKSVKRELTGVLQGCLDVFRYPMSFIRSSVIGIIVGILPGVGGTAAAFICYGTAVQASKHPETFGKGDVEGVIAPQFGIAAERGGAILPTVAFGIPGSTVMALMLAVFMLHGITPGPLLIKEHLDLVWALIWGLALSAIVAAILGLATSRYLARIAEIKNFYIVPIVVMMCLASGYAMKGNFYDMVYMFLAGLFGFGLHAFGYPLICFTMGFILGVETEQVFHQSLGISYGDYGIFFYRPIALVEFIILVSLIVVPLLQNILKHGQGRTRKIKDGVEITR